jgi:hypothetical protein
MDRHHVSLLRSVALITFVASITAAGAEDRSAWFKSLMQPDTGLSCCDISDCRRADADWRDGQWWAVVEGQWTPIPPQKELSKRSIDGDAYVCSSPSRKIYCFVKPNFAM